MKVPGLFAALTALLSTGVDARNLGRLPEATHSVVLPLDGMTPKPTPPPGLHELVRRQDGASSYAVTMAVAPDNTCGYISGNPSLAYTCDASATCGLALSQPTHSGAVICFDANGSNLRFGCVDYNAFYSSSSCDSSCAQDTLVLKCTNNMSKYCNTIAFPGGVTDYWCGSSSNSVVNEAFTTFNGETDSRHYTTFINSDTSTTLFNTKQTGSSKGAGPTASAASLDKASALESSGGGGGGGGGGGSSDGSDGSNSTTPIGAIVGGVVGGVAAIGIAGIALFFCLRNKKKKQGLQEKTAGSPMNHPMPLPQGPPQNMMPGQHQSYYDLKFGGVQGYPPPNQQYPQGTPPPGVYYALSNTPTDPYNPTSSPAVSLMTDPWTTSPSTAGWDGYAAAPPGHQYHQQPAIHEAPTLASESHRGQMHELA